MLALAVLSLIVLEIGFLGAVTPWIKWTTATLVALFAFEHALNWRRCPLPANYLRHWSFHIFMAFLAVGIMLPALVFLHPEGEAHGKIDLLALGTAQGAMVLSLTLRALRHQAQTTRLRLRPGWIFMGSFALLIALGTLLLKLPRAVVEGASLSWLDALFTSTSAVCVTGLAVENTAQFFTTTGQIIILGLIQVGGLGIMTLTFYLSNILFHGLSLHDRQALGEMISEKHLARVSDSVRFIVLFTFAAEAVGAILLFHCLPADAGISERSFQAVFHSVSAFCNAGFSTLPGGLADSWVRHNHGLQLVISLLIILGGLGAAVLRDLLGFLQQWLRRLRTPAQSRPRLRIHTRLVLTVTALLVLGGAASIWLSEFCFRQGEHNGGSVTTALFHSVTARTAGFNTVDTSLLGPVTIQLLLLLMLVGGSPGGTAGGVRTTVFATAAVYVWSLLRNSPDLVLFRRRLPPNLGPRSLAILVLTLAWLFVNFAILRQLQPSTPDTPLLFELVSAFATVGLSMNLTPEITESARGLLILNMFIGRIGLFTVASTLLPVNRARQVQRPTEDLILT